MRKAGSQNLPKLSSFFTQKELEQYVKHLKARYPFSDKVAVFVGEQLFGKPSTALVNEDGKPFFIEISEAVSRKYSSLQNGSNTSSKSDC